MNNKVWFCEDGATVNQALTTSSVLKALANASSTRVALVDNPNPVAALIRWGGSGVGAATASSQRIPANTSMFIFKGDATHFHARTETGTGTLYVTCGMFKGE